LEYPRSGPYQLGILLNSPDIVGLIRGQVEQSLGRGQTESFAS
jgi:hypothetical protein